MKTKTLVWISIVLALGATIFMALWGVGYAEFDPETGEIVETRKGVEHPSILVFLLFPLLGAIGIQKKKTWILDATIISMFLLVMLSFSFVGAVFLPAFLFLAISGLSYRKECKDATFGEMIGQLKIPALIGLSSGIINLACYYLTPNNLLGVLDPWQPYIFYSFMFAVPAVMLLKFRRLDITFHEAFTACFIASSIFAWVISPMNRHPVSFFFSGVFSLIFAIFMKAFVVLERYRGIRQEV